MRINQNIRILLIGAAFWYIGEGMFGPLFAVFSERIGGDILDISWAWATYLIISGILYMFVGKWTDKDHNKSKVMVIGYALNTLATFGYLMVTEPWHLFIVQALLGIAAALATPTWYALYAKYENKQEAGFQWGLAEGSAQIINGVAMIIGGIIVSFLSFDILFWTMGIIQIIATIYQMKILKTASA